MCNQNHRSLPAQTAVVPTSFLSKLACGVALLAALASASPARAGGYTNFSVCVYFRYQEVSSIPRNLAQFAAQWANVEKQVKVAKVYLETTRNKQLATADEVEAMKKFFNDRGIKTSGGMGLTVQEGNGFQSFDYSSQADRDRIKEMSAFTAQHFDEIILDDFYFSNNKGDDAIAAKGSKSWTQFRTELMDDVSKNLIIAPAKEANPKCRVIIKFPNWYESFQGLGYDLAVEPKLFDAIYTGTETRNAEGGQRLQSYQSYLQTDYFNRIKPGANQGGWIDGGGDARYAEQFWDTLFAKVPEIMLFNSQQIMGGLGGRGGRGGGGAAVEPDTNAILANLMEPIPQPDGTTYTPNMVARTAGYSAEILDRFLGKLGKPVGVPTYKPCNSVGEAYLPDYLGMVGVPVDLVPDFPTNATTILLTAASQYDPDLVVKTKDFVQKGGQVIATTGLIEALGNKGFQDIAEIEVTGHRVMATGFGGGRGGFGGGRGRGGQGAAGGGRRGPNFPQQTRQLASPEVIARGKAVYGVNCTACHGGDLRGGDQGGPSLLRSLAALSDQHGEAIAPIVGGSRQDQGMPAFNLSESDVTAVSEYIHSVLAMVGSQARPPGAADPSALNVLVGSASDGQAFFQTKCASCHSLTGDLKGIASKYPDPRNLQNTWVAGGGGGGRGGRGGGPTKPTPVTVTLANGQKLEGILIRKEKPTRSLSPLWMIRICMT